MRCIVFLSAGICLFSPACGGVANENGPISISVDTGAARPINKKVFGVNALFNTRPIIYDHPDLAEKFSELGATVIRFPGGTPANFYNFRTGYFDIDPRSKEFARQMTRVNAATRQTKEEVGGYRTEHFGVFARRTDAVVTVVLNVCTQDARYTEEWLEFLKKERVRVEYIELGNELYLDVYGDLVRDVKSYIAESRRHAAVARKVFPGAKVGVAVSSHSFTRDSYIDSVGGIRDNDRNLVWDSEIAKEDFYDIVVIHLYGSPGVSSSVNLENIPPSEQLYHHCVAHVDYQFSRTMEYLGRTFPGKEIAVTEWHVGGFGGNMRKHRLRYSYLGAVYAAHFFLELLKQPKIILANQHSFAKMVTLEIDAARGRVGNRYYDTKLTTTAMYDAMKFFRDALHASNSIVDVEIDGGGTYEGAGSYKGRFPILNGLFFLEEGRGNLVVVNKFANPVELGHVSIVGQSTTTVEAITMMMPTESDKPLDAEAVKILHVPYLTGDPIAIPGYSVARIKLSFAE